MQPWQIINNISLVNKRHSIWKMYEFMKNKEKFSWWKLNASRVSIKHMCLRTVVIMLEVRFFDKDYTIDLLINRRRRNWEAESEI